MNVGKFYNDGYGNVYVGGEIASPNTNDVTFPGIGCATCEGACYV